ncbi:MAG: DUF4389 domain-containing protein [Gaiellaceae bacterium]
MATAPRRWNAGRIVLLVAGIIATLTAIGLLAGGGALLWADQTQRDDQGYFTTSAHRFATTSYVLATDSLDVASDGPNWLFESGRLARIRIRATGDKPIFLGIGRATDVQRYLAGTSSTRVENVDYHPFRVTYVNVDGAGQPAPPAAQDFWVASSGGPGTRTVSWGLAKGKWSVVLMNADASAGVAADVSAAAKISWLRWLILGLLAAGTVVVFVGALMIYLAVRPRAVAAAAEPAVANAVLEAQSYPVAVEGELDAHLSRWLWLVKWFLAIPHYVVLFFLWIAFFVLTVIAFFAILFTGRYPRGIFDVNVGILRWTWRVGFYATNALGTDRYPPFTLDPVDYPATIEVPYPEQLSRGLVLVKWWLLAIPHYLVLAVLVGGGWSVWTGHSHWGVETPGLLELLVLFAGVVLLFTGQYSQDLFRLILGINRWFFRVVAYASLMRDEYPPFRLER